MRIRLTNPHAQSKDPYPLIRTQQPQGILPYGWQDREGHEFTRANQHQLGNAASAAEGIIANTFLHSVILSQACGFTL